ncbi:MAG TPA: hypothetical protein VL948_17395 [Verrucomicrobiae bacterium]|jgi:hypothetical protein|nr:hypothetical protein [Verrucomicrobiae bacterium]
MVHELPATINVFGSAPVPATARLLRQTPSERMTRVLSALGICWGIAAVAVFMPVAHFILVPTFLLLGIGLAVVRSREDVRLLGAHGRCPRCGVEQDFPGAGRFHGEQALDCPRCHNRLTLTAAMVPLT